MSSLFMFTFIYFINYLCLIDVIIIMVDINAIVILRWIDDNLTDLILNTCIDRILIVYVLL